MKRSTTQTKATRGGARSHRPVRYAVAGLGWIAQTSVLPAFAHTRGEAELAALISSDERKLSKLGKKYRVSALSGYGDFEACLREAEIDAVYIALPNHMHREYTERAARVGVHVLCEKPLASSTADARAMVEAARDADVRLMTAYRLHFDPANLAALEAARSGKLGELRFFSSVFATPVADRENIRLDRERGGGTLWDLGIYCINAVRGLFGAEPEEVHAWVASARDERFREVEEMTVAQLRFPDARLATFVASFGATDVSRFELVGTKGRLSLSNAYEIKEEMELELVVDDRSRVRTFEKRDQFASELEHFSHCVRTGEDPAPSGEEGLADVRVIEALYASIDRREPIRLASMESQREVVKPAPRRPPPRKPQVVDVRNPSP